MRRGPRGSPKALCLRTPDFTPPFHRQQIAILQWTMSILLLVTTRLFEFLVLSHSLSNFSSKRQNETSVKTQPSPDRNTLGYRPTLPCILLYFM